MVTLDQWACEPSACLLLKFCSHSYFLLWL